MCLTEAFPPGSARNEGFKLIDTLYVVFLDIRTIPTTLWPGSLYEFILSQRYDLQLGSVSYRSSSFIQECLLAATYGFKPLPCLPGLITTKEVFFKIGCFLPFRAGEDVEWITRARMLSLKINEENGHPLLTYSLPSNKGILFYVRKWFNYYSASFLTPSYSAQRYLYMSFSLIVIVMSLASWNWIVARWDESSNLYIPHVTRLALLSLFCLYLFVRGIILPVKKGVSLRLSTLPMLFCAFLIAVCLVIAKMAASLKAFFTHIYTSRL